MKTLHYDYLVVASGLYGAIFAHEAKGKFVLVVEKRPNIAGNVYTENIEEINVHKYDAHIFHTNNKRVWDYITRFSAFNRFTNSPVVNYKGELYSLPFNMYTFNKMWGVVTPDEATTKIEEQCKGITDEPKNLEKRAISLVGGDIYKWFEFGKDKNGNDLPKTIISREYSSEWKPSDDPYYPVNDVRNSTLYAAYRKLADAEPKVIFGGLLGEYKYYDMDATVGTVLEKCGKEL